VANVNAFHPLYCLGASPVLLSLLIQAHLKVLNVPNAEDCFLEIDFGTDESNRHLPA